jgi:hypothetical protein
MNRSLHLAAAFVLLASGLALVHVARNRSGGPEAEITLTDRELELQKDSEDSGVQLNLRWRGFFERDKLAALGFDCGMALSDPKARDFYWRQRPKSTFVAFEFDGPALQADQISSPDFAPPQFYLQSTSRLIVIDASRDARALRAQYPNRNQVLILPALVIARVQEAVKLNDPKRDRPARLAGYVIGVPSFIHVPRPFSDQFRHLKQSKNSMGNEGELYRVRLTYGSLGEPWVSGVEFPQTTQPR